MSNELQKAAENASFQMWQAYCDKKMECEDLQEQVEAQAARIAEIEAQVKQLQRVPLSDGRLVEAIESFTGFISGDVDKFVAHIESAHGITQEKQG